MSQRSLLAEIRAHKEAELQGRRERVPLADLQARAAEQPSARPFAEALRRSDRIALIAEVKRASPSRGLLREDFDPVAIATEYATAGADAISVLTDARYFQGSLDYLQTIRAAVDRPLLRKDFTLDPYHVWEARAAGADAVLLIVAMLTDDELKRLAETADAAGLDVLIEVHDEAELERALRLQPRLIGINNRNLHTFQTRLETTFRLRPQVPPGVTVVSESGIFTRADVRRLEAARVDALLVGEALMRAPRPGAKVRELLGRPERLRE